ncbi:MAG TPA: polysaccharide pyruvyl transferase family protein [Acidimicrobiales bacterium]|nr:polysaccharide pyruvyl transferase family protein [Acidimicrobiales bacterium]
MPTALLAGAFGQGNLGDDALVESFVSALPEWQLIPTAADPSAVGPTHRPAVASRDSMAVARRALGCDAVVVGGGTVFKRLHPSTDRRPLALLANAALLVAASSARRRRVAMLGVGAGRLEGPGARHLARYLVRHSHLVVLRDEESAAQLSAAGVPGPFRVGADPAWTLLRPPEHSRPRSARSVLVIPSAWATAGDGWRGMVDRLAETLGRLHASGVELVVQSWQRRVAGSAGDEPIVAELVRRLGPAVEVAPTPGSLPEAVTTMHQVGAVLTYRFHGLVAAGAAGVPALAITHEAKLRGLARRLGQRMSPPAFEPDILAEDVTAALGSAGAPPAVVKEEIARAEEGFRLLRVVLAEGTTPEAETVGRLPLAPWPR